MLNTATRRANLNLESEQKTIEASQPRVAAGNAAHGHNNDARDNATAVGEHRLFSAVRLRSCTSKQL